MGKRIAVRYMVLQGIENGIGGFYEYADDSRCVKPNKPYGKDGVCHTLTRFAAIFPVIPPSLIAPSIAAKIPFRLSST
ncbi:hypothetical protein [Planococcus salinus]|uniref:Uncharacterized protein n=1 Tax=Planococcus salinus TaxID=1848460 RepID=A0A3M8P7F3_9BACL|nr:hypothetical protein [Planococcus salinus]RNF39606.1 hypothetical protein EEX84_09040 [Planococcus salinus]